MDSSNLFETVLVRPAIDSGANRLSIISGYASSAMAFHHLTRIRQLNVEVNLVVGMITLDGISLNNHLGFLRVMRDDFSETFACSYLTSPPAVHSKLYLWRRNTDPVAAFIGSANYTQNAFLSGRLREIVGPCDPIKATKYFDLIASESIFCTHPDADQLIAVYDSRQNSLRKQRIALDESEVDGKGRYPAGAFEKIDLTFVRKEIVPLRSGLNWGQRPEEHRNPNQAYIPLPADIYRSDFFPPIGIHFTVGTDDNKVLICTRAQANGKAIHTPHDNSRLGKYFRKRLGLPSGALVTIQHLVKYGRNGPSFFKLDNETYHMDFSV